MSGLSVKQKAKKLASLLAKYDDELQDMEDEPADASTNRGSPAEILGQGYLASGIGRSGD